jgi:hypothetical protein
MNITFLKKLGLAIVQGIAVASGIGPIVAPLFGAKGGVVVSTVTNDLTVIGQLVAMIEAALQGAKSGAEKLAAVVPLVANVVRTSELVGGRHVADENLFIQGIQKMVNGVVDVLNSLKADVPTSGDPKPAAPVTPSAG